MTISLASIALWSKWDMRVLTNLLDFILRLILRFVRYETSLPTIYVFHLHIGIFDELLEFPSYVSLEPVFFIIR